MERLLWLSFPLFYFLSSSVYASKGVVVARQAHSLETPWITQAS